MSKKQHNFILNGGISIIGAARFLALFVNECRPCDHWTTGWILMAYCLKALLMHSHHKKFKEKWKVCC